MSLKNLIGISLETIKPDDQIILRLKEAAERSIIDAKMMGLSEETRFDAAYKAIMQIANAALQYNGYRTLTSKPGHHQTMISSLTKTLGVDKGALILLDAMRKQRHIIDYTGDLVTEVMTKECIDEAEKLLILFKEKLFHDQKR